MKNQNTVFIIIMSAFAFALTPVINATQSVEGGPDPILAPANPVLSTATPVITIHSTDNVTRGKIGSFVLAMKPAVMFGTYVNFKVSGTAIAGVDYVLLVSPAHIGQAGYGVIQVKTLHDPRGLSSDKSYSVTITLEPGAGYAVGAASSATMWIKPSFESTH